MHGSGMGGMHVLPALGATSLELPCTALVARPRSADVSAVSEMHDP